MGNGLCVASPCPSVYLSGDGLDTSWRAGWYFKHNCENSGQRVSVFSNSWRISGRFVMAWSVNSAWDGGICAFCSMSLLWTEVV